MRKKLKKPIKQKSVTFSIDDWIEKKIKRIMKQMRTKNKSDVIRKCIEAY